MQAVRADIKNRKAKDAEIAKKVLSLVVKQKISELLCYVSKDSEVDTCDIINKAWLFGIRVYAPLSFQSGKMEFYRINAFRQLRKGRFGVEEPIPEPSRLFKSGAAANTLCVVPGLAFDRSFHRIGYGKGYYDRFLHKLACLSVGLCYAETLLSVLPHDHGDKRVNCIITPSETYWREKD